MRSIEALKKALKKKPKSWEELNSDEKIEQMRMELNSLTRFVKQNVEETGL